MSIAINVPPHCGQEPINNHEFSFRYVCKSIYPLHVIPFIVILKVILSSWDNFQIRLRFGYSAYRSTKIAAPCFFFLLDFLIFLFEKCDQMFWHFSSLKKVSIIFQESVDFLAICCLGRSNSTLVKLMSLDNNLQSSVDTWITLHVLCLASSTLAFPSTAMHSGL